MAPSVPASPGLSSIIPPGWIRPLAPGTLPFLFVLAVVPILGACEPQGASSTTGGAEVRAGESAHTSDRLFPASSRPDRIALTWAGDPARSASVTWRTDASVTTGRVQVVRAGAAPPIVEGDSLDFDVEPEFLPLPRAGDDWPVRELGADTRPLAWEGITDHYHTARIQGLEPDTPYAYRVGDGTRWSEWFQFRTAPADRRDFRFLVMGDAQNNIFSYFPRTFRAAVLEAPDALFTLHTGDLALSSGGDYSWGEWFHAGGFHLASIPTLATPGNSDHFRLADREPDTRLLFPHWFHTFDFPANGPAGLEGVTWSVDVAGVRLISLYSNFESAEPGEREILITPDRAVTDDLVEAQTRWLREILADDSPRWTVVFFHHPVRSLREDRERDELRDLWEGILREGGADLVLQGHDHAYGRGGADLSPVAGADGVDTYSAGSAPVYLISNAGGKARPLDPTGNALGWTHRTAENVQLFHVVEVTDGGLEVRTHAASGEEVDRFRIRR